MSNCLQIQIVPYRIANSSTGKPLAWGQGDWAEIVLCPAMHDYYHGSNS